MNRSKRISGIYLPILFAAILISCGLRIAAVLTEFDVRSGYFDNKALIVAAGIVAAASSVLLFTYVFTAPSGRRLRADFSSPAMYVPTGIVSVALIFFAVGCRVQVKKIESTSITVGIPTLLLSLISILALLSVAYFVLNAMITERASIKRAGFGIFAVALMALYAAFLYFDTTLPLNAPNKIVDQMAYLFTAVFLLYEIRISLGRECWNLYSGFGFIAALLCAYSSIPSVVTYFVTGYTLSYSIYETALTFCLCIFVICRVICAEGLYEDKESELVTMIKEAASEREALLEQKRELEREAYLEMLSVMQATNEQVAEPVEAEMFGMEADKDEALDEENVEGATTEADAESDTLAADSVSKADEANCNAVEAETGEEQHFPVQDEAGTDNISDTESKVTPEEG